MLLLFVVIIIFIIIVVVILHFHILLFSSSSAVKKLRWWASVVFLIAVITIASLYIIWLPLTAYGWVKAADIPENKHINPRLKCDGCIPALVLPSSSTSDGKKREPSVVL